MSNRKLRAAVIGGGLGGHHGYAYARAEEYELVATCDINPAAFDRFYERAKIAPDSHLNLISGANASGKTTLLEAIHLLATGRSFRTAQTEQLQKHTTVKMGVVGQLQTDGAGLVRLGLVHTAEGRRVSINGLE